MEITTTLHKTENPDSLELCTPARGGAIKVYCNFHDKVNCQVKIDNAIEMREYANKKLGANLRD